MSSTETISPSEWSVFAAELYQLVHEFSGRQIMAPDTPHHIAVAKVVAFKFVQAARTFKAITLLSERGDEYDSIILGRSMFENFVDVVFLVNNPKEVWRYLEEAADLEEKLQSSNAKYGAQPGHPWYVESRRPSPTELRERFAAMAEKDSHVKKWRRLSLKARVEGANDPYVQAIYEMLYPIASSYTHGASTVLMDYLRSLRRDGSTDDTFHVEWQHRESTSHSGWFFGTLLLLDFLWFLNGLFTLNLDQQLEALKSRHEEIAQKNLAGIFPELQHPLTEPHQRQRPEMPKPM